MPSIPKPLAPHDDGSPDPAVAAALSAFQSGTATPADVLTALSTARLLVPVVALLTESELGAHGLRQEKQSEMALPKLIGQDGREAVLAFTGVTALHLWRPDARPIQALTPQVCQAARHENAAAVVIDIAGPIPFTIEGPMLPALAAIADPSELVYLSSLVSDVTMVNVEQRRPKWLPRWLRRAVG
ncbi:SseB family protein [Acrocarpospora sp. B8E8]|uniref:SseB family protein n=1 Tax=Acrocarpospora sp. B8E8 TaxID=3153572 RepID=UPI00325E18CC